MQHTLLFIWLNHTGGGGCLEMVGENVGGGVISVVSLMQHEESI